GVEVSLGWVASPMRRVIDVQFWKPGECFVIPDGAVVQLNGTPLKMVSRGRKISTTSRFLRVQISAPTCEPALFRSEPFAAGTGETDRIDVEMFGHKGLVEVAGLRTSRSLHVRGGPLEPGKDVTIEWLPTTDLWPDEIVGAEVRIEGPKIG